MKKFIINLLYYLNYVFMVLNDKLLMDYRELCRRKLLKKYFIRILKTNDFGIDG